MAPVFEVKPLSRGTATELQASCQIESAQIAVKTDRNPVKFAFNISDQSDCRQNSKHFLAENECIYDLNECIQYAFICLTKR